MPKPELPHSLTLPGDWTDAQIATFMAECLADGLDKLNRQVPGAQSRPLRELLELLEAETLRISKEVDPDGS